MTLGAKAPEERRRLILAAAVEMLRDKGFAGTRIADIAAVAGTSPALVVYHFGSLDGALAEALTTVEDAFYDEFEAAVPSGADAPTRLRALADLGSQAGPALGDWALWMEVWVRALRDAQARALRRALDARWRATLREIVEAGVAEGAWRCDDPAAAAVRLAALMDGLAVQVALADPDVPAATMAATWLASASAELGVDLDASDDDGGNAAQRRR